MINAIHLFQNQQNQLYKLYSTFYSLTQRHTTTCKQVVLTLNMVNCFKDYRRHIHHLNHILHLASFRSLKLTHWGRVTHICVNKLTITGSDNGLSPDWRQAIIWTDAGILSIGPLGTKLSEILIAIHIFSFKKMHLKMSSGKCRPCCLGLNVLTPKQLYILPLLHSQYHFSWYSGDFRSRSIIRHGFDPQRWNILLPSSEELRYWHERQALYDIYHMCFCPYSVL